MADWLYRFAVIDLSELFVDEAYQRPLSGLFRKVRDEYDPLLVGTLITSDRGKAKSRARYALIDGQSRAEGMKAGGHSEVAPCLVYEDLSRAEEASIFARLQTERRGMATWIRFRAALIAKKPEPIAIAALAQAEGFKVAGDGDERGIKSIAALEWLYRKDPALLARVLVVVREAWGADEADTTKAHPGTRGEILQGIGRFMRDNENVDDRRLMANLSDISPDQLRLRANQLREGSGSSGTYAKFVADALVGVYAKTPRKARAA